MMRCLDPLGWFKWPSLALIASPIAAYPFWLPESPPALECGLVKAEGRTFRAFLAADGSALVLRPTADQMQSAVVLEKIEPLGFDSGGLVLDPTSVPSDRLSCSRG